MTARAAVAEAVFPPKTTTAPAERLRQPSVDAGAGACAGAGAGAGACAARPRQNGDRDVLKEEEKEEEEEEEEDKDIELMELIGEFEVIEQERRDAERLESVLVQALDKTRTVVHRPILTRIARCERWLEKGQARGLQVRSRLEGVLGGLREEAAKALAVEETALAALADASGKAVKWRRLQAALKYEIDTLYLDLAEAKDVARGFAVHEAQEREHALLELKEATEHALDPAWEWMPTGGVGDLGWWKHVGRGDGGGGEGGGPRRRDNGDGGGGGAQSCGGGGGGGPQSGGGGGGAQSGGVDDAWMAARKGAGGGGGAQSGGGGGAQSGGGDDAWMAARKGAGGCGGGRTGSGDGEGAQSDGSGGGPQSRVSLGRGGGGETRCAAAAAAAGKRRSPSKQRRVDARASARLAAFLAQEELLARSLLLEELGEEKVRVLTQDLADQELALSSLVEEGVEWSVSEEEEEEEEFAEGWSPSEEEEEEEEEYEEESVDDEELEPEPEFDPRDTK
jgi:hypothetical protein